MLEESRETTRLYRWAGLLLSATAFCFAFKNIIDLDFWWHLATGRWIVLHHSFITEDVFSFTFRGHPWVDLTWGFEIFLYQLYQLVNGTWLISAAMALLVAATIALGWKIFEGLTRASSPSGSAVPHSVFAGFLVFLAAFNVLDIRWIHRPEQFTHFFGMVFLYLLWKDWDKTSRGLTGRVPLWILPLVQVLWVNTHGLFILGPFLVGLFTVSKIALRPPRSISESKAILKEPLLWVLVATFLACLLNPRGIDGALFPPTCLES